MPLEPTHSAPKSTLRSPSERPSAPEPRPEAAAMPAPTDASAPRQPHGLSFSFGVTHPAPTRPTPPSFAVPPPSAPSMPMPAYPPGTGIQQTTQIVGMMDHDVLVAAQAMETEGLSFVSATPLPPFQTALIFERNAHTFQVIVRSGESDQVAKTTQMQQAGWQYFGSHKLGSFNVCLTYFR